MKKFLIQVLTGIDNETFDIGRVLWALGALTFLGLAIYAVAIKGQAFDAMTYGAGLGTVLAAGGAALGMKATTEPGRKP